MKPHVEQWVFVSLKQCPHPIKMSETKKTSRCRSYHQTWYKLGQTISFLLKEIWLSHQITTEAHVHGIFASQGLTAGCIGRNTQKLRSFCK